MRGVVGIAGHVMAVMVALAAWAPQGGERAYAQTDDPVAVVEGLIEAFNEGIPSGDGAVIAAAFTENGLFTNRDDGFAAVGRPAMELAFGGEGDPAFQVTVTETEVDSGGVTGSADVIDQDTIDAGVASHVEHFTATVEDGLVSLFVLTYGDDPDTLTYLEYLEGLEGDGGEDDGDDEFPGAVEIELVGTQPGHAHVADIPEGAGVAAVAIEVEPGPEEVPWQPAHIHTGTCEEPGGVVYPLGFPVEGASFTLLSTTQADLLAHDYIIDVHLLATEPTPYVSCGALAGADDDEDGGVGLPSTGTGGATDSNGMAWLIAGLAVVGLGGVVGAGTLAARRR